MQTAHAHGSIFASGSNSLKPTTGSAAYFVSGEAYPLAHRLQVLRHWGDGTHSFLTLYPGVQYFRVAGVTGYVPLTISGKFLLIIGQPVCPPDCAPLLLDHLKALARDRGWTIGAIPVGEAGKDLLADAGFTTFYVGHEAIFDLKHLPRPKKSIRQAAMRAQRKGLRLVTDYKPYREQMEALCLRWQDNREIPPLGFLFQLRPFKLKQYKRYFLIVDKSEKVRAFLACSPIYERNGWYLEDLIRDLDAPNGCTELLVTQTLKVLAAQGYDMATLGLAPLAGMEGENRDKPILNGILKFAFEHFSFIYHFKALEHFKSKFRPARWEGNYFCHYNAGSRAVLIWNLLNSFVEYDLRTVLNHKMEKRRVRVS